MASTDNKPELVFSREQCIALEKAFPEKVFPYTASVEEIREYQGVRKVVKWVQSKSK